MEAEGLVFSRWDTSPAGPSRRMYSVTAAGQRWAADASAGLDEVDRVMATWLARYRLVVRRGVETVPRVQAAG